MTPNHCWTVLHVSILAVLLLTLNADSEDSNCGIEIQVHRNTKYGTLRGERLQIECPVQFCNNSPPTISWYKHEESSVPINISSSSHIQTEWKRSNRFKGTAYLIFQSILVSDSGRYQCRSGDSVSHGIKVSVYDNGTSTVVTPKHVTNSTTLDSEQTGTLWMYVYTAAGIVAFVIIVIIISVASMQGCKGKSKTETQTDNQYMAIPIVEQPFPHASIQASPRGSPSAPPSRRSTRRKPPPSQPQESPLPRHNENLYDKMEEDRERQRDVVEEERSSIVYAALNHQAPARAAARPRRPQEESSEYAAIRVKGY